MDFRSLIGMRDNKKLNIHIFFSAAPSQSLVAMKAALLNTQSKDGDSDSGSSTDFEEIEAASGASAKANISASSLKCTKDPSDESHERISCTPDVFDGLDLMDHGDDDILNMGTYDGKIDQYHQILGSVRICCK